ncbi:hydroxyacid dehydrogenase [Gracilibacillus oryzae]|uniref:Hydroxyacid dehydrogenase n=1 Tax=Gracilibacillus oryzae TaxID=1672701 RepID=A0A7C8KSV4_9BACI|nr:hydroxyacid dehydrogenase [Gracilibacillus oryzae]KAB8139038.1 hydroxyacid dehydrogenase [Gracilibacillus oryzae]
MKAIYIMNDDSFELIYPLQIRKEIKKLVDIDERQLSQDTLQNNYHLLKDIDILISGWGGPRLDAEFLEHAPNLKAVFYGAGSIKNMATDHMWDREIIITNAVKANAVPVIEFTISQIVFCLKNGWQFVRDIERTKTFPHKPSAIVGGFGSTVGVISLSTIGKGVCELLKHFDLNVIAYDPFASQEEAERLGVKLCSLDEIFEQSDIVSVHAPLLDETKGMITASHFAKMKQGASFINTARGAIVKEEEMISVLKQREDITAVLDVTDPEPPAPESPLYLMPNVILTPHLAGSHGKECARMGHYMLQELERYVKKEPLQWQVSREEFYLQA